MNMRNNGEAAKTASGVGGPRAWLAANSGHAVVAATVIAATALIFDALDRIGARLDNVEARQRALETTVGQLQAGQRALEAGQRELGIAVQGLQTTGRGLEEAMRELNWGLGRVEGRVEAARPPAGPPDETAP